MKTSRPRRLLMYSWMLLVVRPVVRLLIGVAVFGHENLRFTKPVIIVANHNSHLDALVLMDLIPLKLMSRVRPVAASDYLQQTWMRRFVFQTLMNVLPIRRDKVSKRENPLSAMLNALDAGQSLILFPEGTRGDPEKLSTFRSGIAHVIAKRPDIPVIPVFMRNLGFSLPRGDMILVPMFCDVIIGPARQYSGSRDEIMNQLTATFDELKGELEEIRAIDPPADDR